MSARAALAVVPVVVSDQTSLAQVGMTARQFRAFVAENQVRRKDWRGHVYVRLDDMLVALGLSGELGAKSPAEPAWSEDEIVALAAGRGGQ